MHCTSIRDEKEAFTAQRSCLISNLDSQRIWTETVPYLTSSTSISEMKDCIILLSILLASWRPAARYMVLRALHFSPGRNISQVPISIWTWTCFYCQTGRNHQVSSTQHAIIPQYHCIWSFKCVYTLAFVICDLGYCSIKSRTSAVWQQHWHGEKMEKNREIRM